MASPADKCGESGRAPVAISLQTRAPLVARTIAAHLTLKSDRILREGYRSMLSAQQVKSLPTAVSDHLRKLNRVAACSPPMSCLSVNRQKKILLRSFVPGETIAIGAVQRQIPPLSSTFSCFWIWTCRFSGGRSASTTATSRISAGNTSRCRGSATGRIILIVAPHTGSGEAGGSLDIAPGTTTERNFG